MKRNSRINLALLAGVILAPIVFVFFWQAKDKAAVRKYREQLRASGERLNVDELLPRPVSAEENSAAAFGPVRQRISGRMGQTVLDTNGPVAMLMVAPGRAAVGWQQAWMRDG